MSKPLYLSVTEQILPIIALLVNALAPASAEDYRLAFRPTIVITSWWEAGSSPARSWETMTTDLVEVRCVIKS
jgi:hypothetical protein